MKTIRLTVPLLLLVAVLVAGGWMLLRDDAKQYAVPRQLCDVPVTSSVLAPLLPPGEEVEHEEPDVEPPARDIILYCEVRVDREVVMALSVYGFAAPTPDLQAEYQAAPSAYGIAVPYEEVIDGEYAILDAGGSLMESPCPSRGEDAVLHINIQNFATRGDSGEGRERMKDFTEDFVHSAREIYC